MPNQSTIERVNALIERTIDWYWSFGHLRKGDYSLSPDLWLDQLYTLRGVAARASAAFKNTKPSMALWGPSQSGKSTLLSRYLDGPLGLQVATSALQWKDGEKVRFSARESLSSDWIVLNPYNAGSDATYCVSRFILADSVPDEAYPVEIRLATDEELLLFFAHGYHSECDRKDNSKKEKVIFNSLEWERRIEELTKSAAPPKTIGRIAYERLHRLTEVVEFLVCSHLERFENMENAWRKNLRKQFLQTPILLSDPKRIDSFCVEVLWDGLTDLSDPISQAYLEIRRRLNEYRERFSGKRIVCSYEAAKLLLNIDTFHRVSHPRADAEGNALRRRIQQMTTQVTDDAVRIGFAPGEKLFPSDDQGFGFAFFQGIIRELVFPLKRDFLKSHSPQFCQFLETADLLDFPGVAQYSEKQDLINRTALAGTEKFKIFTEVLKRGKTAAVVSATARHPSIDGFSLLVKITNYPSNTDQLTSGIRSWFRGLQKPWPPDGRHLPINLVLTFCGQFINDVAQNGQAFGFDRAFGKIGNLGILSEPKVAKYFLITYPEFLDRGGKITATDGQRDLALEQINASEEFKRRFADNVGTLDAMVKDGGTDYLVRSLEAQARQSVRVNLVQRQVDSIVDQLKALMTIACPVDVLAAEHRKKEIASWIQSIHQSIRNERIAKPSEDGAMRVSFILRQLLNVPVEALEPVPLQASASDLRIYIEKQFESWRHTHPCKVEDLPHIGIDATSGSRLLGYLCHYALDTGAFDSWMRQNLRHVITREEGKHARHFLALKMSESLVHGQHGRMVHRLFADENEASRTPQVEFIHSRLRSYARNEERVGSDRDDLESPHFRGFIEPFVKHLERVKDIPGRERRAQEGDSELRELIEALPQ